MKVIQNTKGDQAYDFKSDYCRNNCSYRWSSCGNRKKEKINLH